MTTIRTLIVDDSPNFLKSIERFITTEHGIVVIGRALSGKEAINLTAQLSPDLVLMDCTMPGMGGIEAAEVIKRRPHPPRVVMLTINDAPEYEAASLARGADGFVTKSELGKRLLPTIYSLFN